MSLQRPPFHRIVRFFERQMFRGMFGVPMRRLAVASAATTLFSRSTTFNMQANGNGNAENLMVANELTSVGDSDSMTGQRKSVRSILDQFVDSDSDLSTAGISKWDDVPALPLCSLGLRALFYS